MRHSPSLVLQMLLTSGIHCISHLRYLKRRLLIVKQKEQQENIRDQEVGLESINRKKRRKRTTCTEDGPWLEEVHRKEKSAHLMMSSITLNIINPNLRFPKYQRLLLH